MANHPSPELDITSDQALLVLLPQQKNQWLFKRITDWNTASPKEETISFTLSPSQKRVLITEDLKVDSQQHFAVILLHFFGKVTRDGKRDRSAGIVIIDLHSFKIVSQQNTADPFLASSDWEFAENSTVIANARMETIETPAKPKFDCCSYETLSDRYKAAALSLPSLEPSMQCEYTRFLDHRSDKTSRTWQLIDVSDGCAQLIALAHVLAADDLPDSDYRPKPEPYAKLAGPNCLIEDKSHDLKYALYDCRTENAFMDEMIVIGRTRDLVVLQIPGGQHALNVPLPHNLNPYPALLANVDSHEWLLLLRDGINLEIYRVP